MHICTYVTIILKVLFCFEIVCVHCVYLCLSVCGYVHRSADAIIGQKRATEPLELELTCSCELVCYRVLGTDLGSFGRAASILNH